MQGLPDGWVTDVPGLSRNAMLKALGNGVVPQQAAMALRLLLDRLEVVQAEAVLRRIAGAA
jgi:DNA (cytosine-5)-methyltransferase 1